MAEVKGIEERMTAAIDAYEAAAQERRTVLFELLQVRETLKVVIASDHKDVLAAREIDLQVAYTAAQDKMQVADMRLGAIKAAAQQGSFGDLIATMAESAKEGLDLDRQRLEVEKTKNAVS